MQSIEINGLDRVIKGLETTAQVIREARGEVMDEMGQELLGGVQRRIGGSGRVAGVQEYKVGSGTGYVAVRAKADTYLDGYAAGYITNSLENGHAIRQPSGTAKRRQKSRAKIASVPGKHMDGMQSKLNALNKTKATLKVDVDKAKSELKAAEKQFAATGDVVDQLVLQAKQLTFEEARRNLSLVSKEAANVEKQMLKTGDAFSKTENKASGGWSSAKTVVGAIAASGIGDMLGSLAKSFASSTVSSAFGANAGSVFSSALSSAASGAAIGSMILPGLGTAIGAAAGGVLGAASGGLSVLENKDSAFKSYVQDAYDTVTQEQSSSLTTGSTIAARRETDRISLSFHS